MAAARSRFLHEASQLLATKSPTVSSELLQGEAIGDASSQDRSLICRACGSLFIPGWNSTFLRNAKSKKRSRQDRVTNRATSKTASIQCSHCGSVTVIQSDKPGRKRISGQSKSTPASENTTTALEPAPKPSPNLPSATVGIGEPGSKKRARNKKSSLQSMLADRKSVEQKKAPALDLMDFMKT